LQLSSDLRIARGFAARFYLTRLQLNLGVIRPPTHTLIFVRADRRAIRVSAALAAAGAIVGALAGAASIVSAFVLRFGPRELLKVGEPGALLPSAAVGACFGCVVGPAVAWLLLRHVSIGRMLLVTAVGTVTGAVLGEWIWPLNPYSNQVPGIVRGALLGFAIAVVILRVTATRVRHLDAAV
jgi:hypothetical protein